MAPPMSSPTNNFVWATPSEGRKRNGIDVSSYGKPPYNRFSPFCTSGENLIPVPGLEHSIKSESVEGIWQGLKVINGVTDPTLFTGKPHKRKGNVQYHLYGSTPLNKHQARNDIYVPAYLYHVINNALTDHIAADLENRLEQGDVTLYDVEDNPHIRDISRPYSHAALLVDILSMLKAAPLPPFHKPPFQYMNEQIDAVIEHRRTMTQHRSLLDEYITFACLFSPDTLKQRFALDVLLHDVNIDDKRRIARYSPSADTMDLYDAMKHH